MQEDLPRSELVTAIHTLSLNGNPICRWETFAGRVLLDSTGEELGRHGFFEGMLGRAERGRQPQNSEEREPQCLKSALVISECASTEMFSFITSSASCEVLEHPAGISRRLKTQEVSMKVLIFRET